MIFKNERSILPLATSTLKSNNNKSFVIVGDDKSFDEIALSHFVDKLSSEDPNEQDMFRKNQHSF
jgi:hypothetical protein